ncbi:hypothetical protein JAAARDRAFT_37438 [Jaapia argillacea MUCL 33604]|uniref:Uncharacterized protein n=1 Tax=Jaapia argillacea MUCL 33604 TaxID=933084 RepID=A0A067PNP0_9AGAM|nr:hypothetical protein JAAARDRAFT_37438 [Jaapia argillacea MUCL 33604]
MTKGSINAAPVNKLPVELLSYIFNLGTHSKDIRLEDRDEDEDEGHLDFDPFCEVFPHTVASVNRHWRRVALSTSTIWTNVCVTISDIVVGDGDDDGIWRTKAPARTSRLDTSRVDLQLIRSRSSPLDIIIDSRDPDWDFSEPESYSDHNMGYDPDHPFSSTHMMKVLYLLLPHLPRWRSLAILTDTYAPMYTALTILSNSTSDYHFAHAPLLESLILMRCNEFASYCPSFSPPHLKGALLPFAQTGLPQLRKLVLSGVHVDWSAVHTILPLSSKDRGELERGLETLELGYHSEDVRPTPKEFADILKRCPDLRRLTVRVSGPVWEGDTFDRSEMGEETTDAGCVCLPELQSLTIGYTDVMDATSMLAMMEASNLRAVRLEDTNHAASLHDEDSTPLLEYFATGPVDDLEGYGPEVGKGAHCVSPFPMLEDVTLERVQTSTHAAFELFYSALPNLKSLSLAHASVSAYMALWPKEFSPDPSSPNQLPNLESLRVRTDQFPMDWITSLVHHRSLVGLGLKRIRIDPVEGEDDWEEEVVDLTLGIDALTYEDNVDVAMRTSEDRLIWNEEDEAFKPGGAFDDPIFDSFFPPSHAFI